MRIYGIRCVPDYDTDTEDTKDYTYGWIPANTTVSWNDVTTPYRYHHNNDKEMPTYTGYFGTYGSGGYLTDLDIVPTKTIDLINNLTNGAWLDERTRVLFVEACLVNKNNMLFTQVQIMFEFPGTGGIFTKTTVVSSNLYPYTDTFDFIILFLHVLFVITVFVRFVFVVAKVIKTRGHSLVTAIQVIDVLHLGVSATAIVCLVMRLTGTIAVLNALNLDMGFYTSFGLVFQWDEYYSISLGMTTFIAILDLLKHLSFNYHIFLMYRTILAFRAELFQFTITLTVLIVGFACFINLMYGHTEGGFRSIPIAIQTLFRMTIGMIKFRNDIQVAVTGMLIAFAVYALVATVCFVNLFVSSLDYRLTTSKQLIKDGLTSFDWHLSGHFWNRLARLFTVCGATRPNKRRKNGLKSGIDLQKGELSFCRFLSKVIQRFGEDTDLEKTALQTVLLQLKRRCRRRATLTGTQYRYSIDWAKEDDTLIIEFFGDKLDYRINVDWYTLSDAGRQGMIPYGNATEPLSMLFEINLFNRGRGRANTKNIDVMDGRHSQCIVMIKVPTNVLSFRTTFLIMSSGNLGDWCQFKASHLVKKEGEVYLSATVSSCPQYVMAVACDLWPGVPLVIQQNNAIDYVLTEKGDVFHLPGQCKKIVLMFPEGCVSLDTAITILFEPGEEFPILHVLAHCDVLGPITVQFRRNRNYQPQNDHVPEIKLLTKEGDMDWKEGIPGTQTNPSDLSVQIECLRRGVKTSITACEYN
ncbi:polycystic kidney disease 2-like 1 protein [Pecten maximus]|uniref:polycystic kidney disease 2-like 1 protein n=1 Tax=Pecten maximus TaxID=6579 RepID=UPI0014587BE2|nr:polycystic kidney disease 2-like 1 protein [Pecten maximus]